MLFKLMREFKGNEEGDVIYVETKSIMALTSTSNGHTNILLQSGETFCSTESIQEFVARMRESSRVGTDLKGLSDTILRQRSKIAIMMSALKELRSTMEDTLLENQLGIMSSLIEDTLSKVSAIE